MDGQRVIKTEREWDKHRERLWASKRGSKASVRRLGACEPWQHGLKPPKRNLPLQWQIRQIRDDPWKPIGVLTAGERPWLRPAGCITVGKRSCQGQAGPRLLTMPPHWRHTVRAGYPFFLHSPLSLHALLRNIPRPFFAQLHFGGPINWQVLKSTHVSDSGILTTCKGTLGHTDWKVLTGKA